MIKICTACGVPTTDIGGLCAACVNERQADRMSNRLDLIDATVAEAVEILNRTEAEGTARADVEYVRDRLILGGLNTRDQVALAKILNSALTKMPWE